MLSRIAHDGDHNRSLCLRSNTWKHRGTTPKTSLFRVTPRLLLSIPSTCGEYSESVCLGCKGFFFTIKKGIS